MKGRKEIMTMSTSSRAENHTLSPLWPCVSWWSSSRFAPAPSSWCLLLPVSNKIWIKSGWLFVVAERSNESLDLRRKANHLFWESLCCALLARDSRPIVYTCKYYFSQRQIMERKISEMKLTVYLLNAELNLCKLYFWFCVRVVKRILWFSIILNIL